MRDINLIVVHCAATKVSQDFTAADIDKMHKARGFERIGYHFVIRRSGQVEPGRPLEAIGAHVQGHNANSIGICLIGGVGENGKAANNFTPEQFDALAAKLTELRQRWPTARIGGHRDLSPDLNHDGKVSPNEWMKDCPSFSVADFLAERGL